MKRYSILLTVLVLTMALLTGCGCTRQGAGNNTMPATEMTILPTNIPETTAPIMPSTEPATEPSSEAETETVPMGTEDSATESGSGETDAARNRMR